jgi:hypothetical protein
MEERHFALAHEIARGLAEKGTDVNELATISAYLASKRNMQDFFTLLDWLASPGGKAVVRSGKTTEYYIDIRQACHALREMHDTDEMAQVLGWSVRLMRYYNHVLSRGAPR